MPPPELATRVLGALSLLAEDESGVNGVQLVDRSLGTVGLAFPAKPTRLEGLCVRRWLGVEFEPAYPTSQQAAEGAMSPMRASGFSSNEQYRVVGPIRPWKSDANEDEESARRAACAQGSATARYFMVHKPDDLVWAVQAVQRALVKMRGEAEATIWLGKLKTVLTDSCRLAHRSRICIRAYFSEDDGSLDDEGHMLVIDDVHSDGREKLEAIGKVRFEKAPHYTID